MSGAIYQLRQVLNLLLVFSLINRQAGKPLVIFWAANITGGRPKLSNDHYLDKQIIKV